MNAILAERRTVAGVLRDCGVSPADLDDLTQEVVVAAWRAIKAGRYRPNPSADASLVLRAWLRGVAWRQATHWRDRSWRRREEPQPAPRELVDMTEELAPDALDLMLSREVGARFSEACSSLRPEFQQAILAILSGQSPEEYARATGINVNTVRNRIRIARAEMKAHVDRAKVADRWSVRRRT
jgi:RNA polymerase sigma factor (sigma-70 family)